MRITGTGALVTGGASGLGAATVRRLAGAGAQVVIADLNAQAGEALAAELGDAARFVATDVTSEDSMRAAVQTAASLGNGLRILVNCAGIAIAEKVIGKDTSARSRPFRQSASGQSGRHLQRHPPGRGGDAEQRAATPSGERGVIVNTASVAAFDGQIGQAAYSRLEGRRGRHDAADRARVGALSASASSTHRAGHLRHADAGRAAARRRARRSASRCPSRRGWAAPTSTPRWCGTSSRTTMLNGETIRLDGAIRMAPR